MDIKNSADLKVAILELEDRKSREKQQLVENFHVFTESLKPINLVKSAITKVKESHGLSGNVMKATVGLGIGLLSKKFLIGGSSGIIKKVIGSAIEMALAGIVAKNSDTIKSKGFRLFKNIFRSK